MNTQFYNLICLGDSYTIGEGVPLFQSFPYQVVQLLRRAGYNFNAPEIIAKTGFTSFELIEQINKTKVLPQYQFATLLVGVNNQYRGLNKEDFEKDFYKLVQTALSFINNKPQKLIILSIPDWGCTPFAKDRDEQTIHNEINAFNGVCELAAQKMQTKFINITESTRKAKYDNSLLTSDALHYSAKEMAGWASLVKEKIIETI